MRRWLSTTFNLDNAIKEKFGLRVRPNADVDKFISICESAYKGAPYWIDVDNHISTVNFAKSICSETARLATMNISLDISGSARADWLKAQVDAIDGQIRKWVEYGCAAGTIILKPNGDSVDFIAPDDFRVTESKNGEITGVVFLDYSYDGEADKWYTRLEYHRFDGEKYIITNKTFIGRTAADLDKEIPIEKSPWAGLAEEITAEGVDRMLFGVLKTPQANNIDANSALSLPIFADAMEELKALDIAYSRNVKEIADSKRIVLIDSDRLLATPGSIGMQNRDALVASANLPDYIKAVEGTGTDGDVYHEINPSLNTDTRLAGIDALLSQIGFKCGFSNGYFVFNEKTGMITATQVESDDRRTIQLINDVRKQIEVCFDGLIYALDKFADAYNLAPRGTYEVTYDFADLTLNEDEDKARWYSYVTAGRVPFWYYLMRFEGMSEEEAKQLEAEAQTNEPVFGDEE